MDLRLTSGMTNSPDATQSRIRTNSYPDEDDLLMLSGIQHIAFCERQWALIHIEQQWHENIYTVEGHQFHEHVDDPLELETHKDIIILRSVSLVSHKLGLYGRADVVELQKAGKDEMVDSIEIKDKPGRWLPIPIEYKRGKPKPDERDEVQLCAQAMCLEEMYGISIPAGWLYYGKTRHRHKVFFSDHLRNLVVSYSLRMHELFKNGFTPAPVLKPHCKSCSLVDVCLPESMDNRQSASQYLKISFEK